MISNEEIPVDIQPDGELRRVRQQLSDSELLRGKAVGAMRLLLSLAGDLSACKGCGGTIYWVTHRNGKSAPYDVDGVNHFITCKKADDFKTKKRSTDECR